MSKKIKANVKLQLPGGGATPAPPVGSTLGQHQVPLMDFCKKFNAQTAGRKGETVPVVITVFQDRTFTFVTKTPPASELIKKNETKMTVKKSKMPSSEKLASPTVNL